MMRDAVHERALLDSLGDGDESAFWSLWQEYQRHLYAVCLRQMKGAHFDAADAVSRSMMVARAKLPAYATHIDNLEAWLTRLTCNVCMDMHRERQRAQQGRINLDDHPPLDDPALSCGHSPEDEYLSTEVGRIIAACIAELPLPLRDVANLRFVQEMDYPVIAELLDISVENARKRVQQARAFLRERITVRMASAAVDPLRVGVPAAMDGNDPCAGRADMPVRPVGERRKKPSSEHLRAVDLSKE